MNFIIMFNYVMIFIFIAVSITWIYFILVMSASLKHTPYLNGFKKITHNSPKVSIILPARNEERFIEKCLQSLICQDYENFEIVAVNDSSTDNTNAIIKKYANMESKIIHVNARKKPSGWIGKNWACVEGYKRSSGEIMLFTDADTTYHKSTVSLSISHFISLHLHALTVIPKIACMEIWTKITLPILSVFLHTRFSAIKVNDPKKKIGYFFGSFFLIDKKTYEKIGTHQKVKHEIIEDGALGKIMKNSGYNIRMVRGEEFIEAVWSRDLITLWNALKRLVLPLHIQSRYYTVGIFVAMLFLLFMPIPFSIYSIIHLYSSHVFVILLAISVLAISVMYYAVLIEIKEIGINSMYTVLIPIGAIIILSSFLYVMLQKDKHMLSWRDRTYSKYDLKKSLL